MDRSHRYIFRPMSPEAFRAACQRIDHGGVTLARLLGVAPAYPDDWGTGKREIPPWVPIVLALLAMPGALFIAWQVREAHLIGRKDDPEAVARAEREGVRVHRSPKDAA